MTRLWEPNKKPGVRDIPDADPGAAYGLASFALDPDGRLCPPFIEGDSVRLLVVQLEPPIWPE